MRLLGNGIVTRSCRLLVFFSGIIKGAGFLVETSMVDYLEQILRARVYDVAVETPLQPAPNLGASLGCEVLLKREDMQPVFSFKIRGAFNMIAKLDPSTRDRGVIAASAGNHAQGVALAAQHFGIDALIVMPEETPAIKVEAVKRLGAAVLLRGETFQEANSAAIVLARSESKSYIPPFDHPDIIAGQGTVGVEILRQCPEPLDAVFVCVGGGGLAAGVGAYIKRLSPGTRIIGVEPIDAPSMYASLKAGEPVTLERVGLFADGAAVKRVGDETFRVCQKVLDEVLLVSHDEICAAIKDVFEDTRTILEPAGALGVAGAKQYIRERAAQGARVVAITSGANMNFDRLRYVAERAEIGKSREALFAVTIPEQPGSFRSFCNLIGERSITEFNYRYAHETDAHVFVGIAIHSDQERSLLLAELEAAGLPVWDLSDDELSKNHIKHMVGGRNASLGTESIVQFSFPERRGALRKFLDDVGISWNISLFHYRSQGGNVARVLVGFQVAPDEYEGFRRFLEGCRYHYVEGTDNPACRLFL
jgi:threonine dehydratase